MKVGYMRVSKDDGTQVFDFQHDALIAAGVEPEKIWEDKVSGKRDDRPGLAGCLKSLNAGDVLVIWRLDRLGRNLKHLVETVEELGRRGVDFQVITGAPIDTTMPVGKFVSTIFAGLAAFERDTIVERTCAGFGSRACSRSQGGTQTSPYVVEASAGASSHEP